jgi:acetolactate synthase-1/3 small subunit
VSIFEGKVLDVGHNQLTVSLEDVPERVDDFEDLLRPYGIENLQRTGRIALPRLGKTVTGLRDAQSRAS